MKKLLLLVGLFTALGLQYASAQDSSSKASPQITELFSAFYGIKESLAAGKADKAATSATAFIKEVNGIDYKEVSEGNIHALLKDAGAISATTDIGKQQRRFDNLSSNMAILAKAFNITIRP